VEIDGYAAFADGRPAAVSVGSRPTFDGATPGVIEVHVLDFDGDLYGREMRLSFVTRLRGEQRYEDVTELVAQIERDVERVRAIAGRDLSSPADGERSP
jgi:riboflavin kinase/FMN adenylyltransferase